ncbi:MAG: DUF6301 family protein [Propionibacteriaceae bacterium]|nr:DUF6301 family protein [Propionibacteriaceae bacterium]
MTWRAVSPEQAIRWIQYWIDQNWPLTPEKVSAAMAGIGWARGDDGRWRLDIPLEKQHLSATGKSLEHGLNTISWHLTDVELEESVSRDLFVNDSYSGYVKAATELYGKARNIRTKKAKTARWDLPNGCRLELDNSRSFVGVYIYSPNYAQVLRKSERR